MKLNTISAAHVKAALIAAEVDCDYGMQQDCELVLQVRRYLPPSGIVGIDAIPYLAEGAAKRIIKSTPGSRP